LAGQIVCHHTAMIRAARLQAAHGLPQREHRYPGPQIRRQRAKTVIRRCSVFKIGSRWPAAGIHQSGEGCPSSRELRGRERGHLGVDSHGRIGRNITRVVHQRPVETMAGGVQRRQRVDRFVELPIRGEPGFIAGQRTQVVIANLSCGPDDVPNAQVIDLAVKEIAGALRALASNIEDLIQALEERTASRHDAVEVAIDVKLHFGAVVGDRDMGPGLKGDGVTGSVPCLGTKKADAHLRAACRAIVTDLEDKIRCRGAAIAAGNNRVAPCGIRQHPGLEGRLRRELERTRIGHRNVTAGGSIAKERITRLPPRLQFTAV